MSIGAYMNFCTFCKSILVPQINRQSLLWGPVCNCVNYCQGVPWKSPFTLHCARRHWRHAVRWPSCSASRRGPGTTMEAASSLTCSPSPTPPVPSRNFRIGATIFFSRASLFPPPGRARRRRSAPPHTERPAQRAPSPPLLPSRVRNRGGTA